MLIGNEKREIISKLYQVCRYNCVELLTDKTWVRKLEALSDSERCAIGNCRVPVRMNDGSRQVSTCLLLASLTADLDVIKFILRHTNIDATQQRDSRHETVLHKACKSRIKAEKKTEFLVSKYPELTAVATPCGTLPIHVAAKHNKVRCLEILLKGDKKQVSTPTSRGMTPLHIAVTFGCLEATEFLIKCEHTNVNTQDSNGNTPAHHASYNSHMDCLYVLVNSPSFEGYLVNKKLKSSLWQARKEE